MRKLSFLSLLVLVLSASITFYACNNASAEKIDVARGITPMVTPSPQVVSFIEEFRQTDPADQSELLSKNSWLNNRLIMYSRENKYIPTNAIIDSVVYRYGSSNAQAADKTGELFKGKITNELVGFVYLKNVKDPIGVIVYCTNGTFGPLSGKLQRVGALPASFTIEKGNGINSYVDYQTAIMLAEYFGLSLYRGRVQTEANQITPNTAKNMESEIDRTQVTVKVFPGDYFNLNDMTYNGRPGVFQ